MGGSAQVVSREAILEQAQATKAESPLELVERLVAEHSLMAFRIAWSILRNHHDAEDAVQECFLRVLKHVKRRLEVRNPKTWIARIAWTTALDRRTSRARVLMNEDAADSELLIRLRDVAPGVDQQFDEVEDGKKINARTYTVPVTSVDGSPRDSSITVGTRVPVATATTTDNNTVFQYLDVGLKIDCNLTEQDNKFIVHGDVELSSVVLPDQRTGPLSLQPVIRRIRQTFTTLVPPGKPTVVTTSDDINSKKRMEVEITATRLE